MLVASNIAPVRNTDTKRIIIRKRTSGPDAPTPKKDRRYYRGYNMANICDRLGTIEGIGDIIYL